MDSSLFFFYGRTTHITDGRRHGDGNGTGGRRVCTDRRDEESQQRRNGRTGTDSHGWIVAAVAERVLLIRQHTLFKTKNALIESPQVRKRELLLLLFSFHRVPI